MINSIDTLGLRVETVSPIMFTTGVDVNAIIKVGFNSELNTDTIIGNFVILKDSTFKYVKDTAIVVNDYEIVEGLVTYENKNIIFSPSNQLDTKARYIIYVKKDKISDILGNLVKTDYIGYFDTEDFASFGMCSITEPLSNSILPNLTKVIFDDIGSLKYIIQISKVKTFDVIVSEDIVQGTVLEKDFALGDGLYYIRVKAESGIYGEPTVFSIKTHRNTAPTEQDLDEDYIYAPYDDDKLELVAAYPENDSIDNNVKTNLMYVKFNKIIPIEGIDFEEAIITGGYTDQDDNFDAEYTGEHGEVDGTFSVVYDEENEETYVFFIPTDI